MESSNNVNLLYSICKQMMKAMILKREDSKSSESDKQLGAVPILGHRVLGRRTMTSCSELDHQETQLHLRMRGGAVVVTGSPWEGVGVGCRRENSRQIKTKLGLGQMAGKEQKPGWENELRRGMAVNLGELQGPLLAQRD